MNPIGNQNRPVFADKHGKITPCDKDLHDISVVNHGDYDTLAIITIDDVEYPIKNFSPYAKYGVFVLGTANPDQIPLWSADGINWNQGTNQETKPGIYVATTSATSTTDHGLAAILSPTIGSGALVSTNGKDWKKLNGIGGPFQCSGVYDGHTRIFSTKDSIDVTGGEKRRLRYTDDGVSVSSDNDSCDLSGHAVGKPAYGNSVVVIPHYCNDGSSDVFSVWYSDDGGSTKKITGEVFSTDARELNNCQRVCEFLNNKFVMLFIIYGQAHGGRFSLSDDGKIWKGVNEGEVATVMNFPTDLTHISYGYKIKINTDRMRIATNGTIYVAAVDGYYTTSSGNGGYALVLLYSTDLINWTHCNADDLFTIDGTQERDVVSVAYGNGVFVASAHSSAGAVLVSSDGINWTRSTDNLLPNHYSVSFLKNPTES